MYRWIVEAEVRRLEMALAAESSLKARAKLIPQLRRAQLKLDIMQRRETKPVPNARAGIAL